MSVVYAKAFKPYSDLFFLEDGSPRPNTYCYAEWGHDYTTPAGESFEVSSTTKQWQAKKPFNLDGSLRDDFYPMKNFWWFYSQTTFSKEEPAILFLLTDLYMKDAIDAGVGTFNQGYHRIEVPGNAYAIFYGLFKVNFDFKYINDSSQGSGSLYGIGISDNLIYHNIIFKYHIVLNNKHSKDPPLKHPLANYAKYSLCDFIDSIPFPDQATSGNGSLAGINSDIRGPRTICYGCTFERGHYLETYDDEKIYTYYPSNYVYCTFLSRAKVYALGRYINCDLSHGSEHFFIRDTRIRDIRDRIFGDNRYITSLHTIGELEYFKTKIRHNLLGQGCKAFVPSMGYSPHEVRGYSEDLTEEEVNTYGLRGDAHIYRVAGFSDYRRIANYTVSSESDLLRNGRAITTHKEAGLTPPPYQELAFIIGSSRTNIALAEVSFHIIFSFPTSTENLIWNELTNGFYTTDWINTEAFSLQKIRFLARHGLGERRYTAPDPSTGVYNLPTSFPNPTDRNKKILIPGFYLTFEVDDEIHEIYTAFDKDIIVDDQYRDIFDDHFDKSTAQYLYQLPINRVKIGLYYPHSIFFHGIAFIGKQAKLTLPLNIKDHLGNISNLHSKRIVTSDEFPNGIELEPNIQLDNKQIIHIEGNDSLGFRREPCTIRTYLSALVNESKHYKNENHQTSFKDLPINTQTIEP